jgi:hypothetical protein
MPAVYCIEDELHAEQHSSHESLEAAMLELERLAEIPWDAQPNRAPCTSWQRCGRQYELVEYETSTQPWRELRRTPALSIEAGGVEWAEGFARA